MQHKLTKRLGSVSFWNEKTEAGEALDLFSKMGIPLKTITGASQNRKS